MGKFTKFNWIFKVLNLNLSNLLLLLVLKAVVFGANYIGNQDNRGRELNQGICWGFDWNIIFHMQKCIFRRKCSFGRRSRPGARLYDRWDVSLQSSVPSTEYRERISRSGWNDHSNDEAYAAVSFSTLNENYLHALDLGRQNFAVFFLRYAQLDKSYEKTMTDFEKAIDYGTTNQCPPEYTCKKESIRHFLRPE